jgi:hypothetical protein
MATPDEVKKQKELNDLLEQENRILKERLRLQSDSYDLSSTLLEDLKETLGIRSKLTTYEKGVYDINKQINRTIRDQKIEFNGVNDITKQIKKNSDLLNKSKLFEQGLEKSLSDYQKKKAEGYLKNVNIAEKINRKIQEELNKAEKGEKVNNNKINGLKGSLNVINKTLQSEERSLGILAKQYVLTKKQREELDKQNKAREKEEKALKEAQKRLGILVVL